MDEPTVRPVLSVSPSLRVPWSGAPTTASADPWGLCDHGPVTVLLWAWSPLETGAAAPPCPSGLHEGDYGRISASRVLIWNAVSHFGRFSNLDWASAGDSTGLPRAPRVLLGGLLCVHLPGP